MFSCFTRPQIEENSKSSNEKGEEKESDLYNIIEESIYILIGEINYEEIINEIFFYTKNKMIGTRSLAKILKSKTRNPDQIINFFSENFLFISEPEQHKSQLKRLYNDFNNELIILSQLRLLPSERKKLDVFIDHIKDISFAMPERPADIKFNSLALVFFFLIYSRKVDLDKKISMIFNILNPQSLNYIVSSSLTAALITDYVHLSLFFIDIEFNSRLKSEAQNIVNKEFFSKTKLETIIFFKKILMIYHNFPKSTMDDMVIYFLHNMFITVQKSDSKIKFTEFLANFKTRNYDIFNPSATRSFMMNFLTFNKTFFNLLINSTKHYILHYESVYDDTCTSKHPKPKITNQDQVIEFNMVENLKILDNIFQRADYYNNIFKKDFFKVKKEGDEVKEMFVTTGSYTKSTNKLKRSTLSLRGFQSNNLKEKDNKNKLISNPKDSKRKSTAPTPARSKHGIGMKEKSALSVNRMKKSNLEVISEQEENPYERKEERKPSKSKIRKFQISEKTMLGLAKKIEKPIPEGEEHKEEEENKVKEEKMNMNVDIDAMIINDEQYRLTENKLKEIKEESSKKSSKKNSIIELRLNSSRRDHENSKVLNESKKNVEKEFVQIKILERDKDLKERKKESFDNRRISKELNENSKMNLETPIGVTPDEINPEKRQIVEANANLNMNESQRIPHEINLSKPSNKNGRNESKLVNQSNIIRDSKENNEEIKASHPNNESKHIFIDLRESKPINQSSKMKDSKHNDFSKKIEFEIGESRHMYRGTEVRESKKTDDAFRESITQQQDNPIRESTQKREIVELDLRDNRFSEGNKELSDIEKMERDSEVEKDSIIIDFKEKNDMKMPRDLDGSMMFTDTEFIPKKESIPENVNNIYYKKEPEKDNGKKDIKIESKVVNYIPRKNPFPIKKNLENENNTINRYHNMTDDQMNFKLSKEPIDIILGQREEKANAYQNIENSAYKFQSEKVDLNLESLNIVLKPNKNQQSFMSNQKSLNDKLKSNNMLFNANNINMEFSSSEHASAKDNKDQNISDKIKNRFGNFLIEYFESFSNPNISAISTLKTGVSMLGIKTLQEKLKEKLPKIYYSKLQRYIKSFNSNSIKDILSLNMNVEVINMYFILLQIYNDYKAETNNIHRIKIFDISLFLNLQDCFTNGNFEPLVGYFKDEDIFSVYNRIIIPIYVENNMDVNENLILSLFDIKEQVIYFYDAKGILICDMNIIENYKIMFENCFKFLSEKELITKENVNWKTLNDEAIPDFLQEYAVSIILYVAENLARDENVTFDNDNIDAEFWNERIFVQIAEFFIRLNRKN